MTDPRTSTADQIGEGVQRGAQTSNGAQSVEDAVRRNLDLGREKLGEAADLAASRIEEAHAFITRQAREKPVQTTAVAIGAGLLLGLFMAGGRRR